MSVEVLSGRAISRVVAMVVVVAATACGAGAQSQVGSGGGAGSANVPVPVTFRVAVDGELVPVWVAGAPVPSVKIPSRSAVAISLEQSAGSSVVIRHLEVAIVSEQPDLHRVVQSDQIDDPIVSVLYSAPAPSGSRTYSFRWDSAPTGEAPEYLMVALATDHDHLGKSEVGQEQEVLVEFRPG